MNNLFLTAIVVEFEFPSYTVYEHEGTLQLKVQLLSTGGASFPIDVRVLIEYNNTGMYVLV